MSIFVGQYCNVNLKYLVMAVFFAVDKDGSEWIYSERPQRDGSNTVWCIVHLSAYPLPEGAISRLIGRPLSWEDEPVELNEDSLTPKT